MDCGRVGVASDTVIAARYDVDEELARGGMGNVYRVVERSTGRGLALKQLRTCTKRFRELFEREYRTLARLSHPRIIRVYDYGEDDKGPFYTMELLPGRDLRELAPLPYEQACRHLRDVAFSLSLLHARGYLHRDVSPRNIRLDAYGRAKLIDFGAMMPFGRAHEIMGTPPCIPPEALNESPLDARSDLFALGAVAYWLLVGQNAYSATKITELAKAWQRPVTPLEAWLPDLPDSLDRLISAMLEQDPKARPASSIEVIDALDAILGGGADREVELEQSFVASLPLIGRDEALGRIQEHVEALRRGHGTALSIQGEGGVGRTRLLRELRLSAQLAGCVVAAADGEVQRGPYGPAGMLVSEIFRVAPEAAARAASGYAELAGWFPEFGSGGSHRGSTPSVVVRPERACVQKRFEEWLFEVAQRTRLVLSVDNFEAADELSAALIASLAHAASEMPVYLVAALRTHDTPTAKSAVEAFVRTSQSITLCGFSANETAMLVGALFAGDSRTGRLATWLHDIAGGNPLGCTEIARHLIERGIVHYVGGVWVLPVEFSGDELPNSASVALGVRLETASADARDVAMLLAVADGPLSFDRLVVLRDGSQPRELSTALNELVARGLATESDRGYRLANTAVREVVASRIPPKTRRTLHRLLGERLLREGSADVGSGVEAGWHLLQGGELSKGADVLARLAPEIERLALGDGTRALEAAVEIYEREQRPEAVRASLRATLVALSLPLDWRLKRFEEPTLRDLSRLIGLTRASRLEGYLGKKLALLVGFGVAKLRYELSKPAGAPEFSRQVTQFVAAIGALGGVAAFFGDTEQLSRLLHHTRPFRALGRRSPGHAVYDLLLCLLAHVQGREADAFALAEELARRELDGLTPGEHVRFTGGVLVTLGTMNVYRADSQALMIADRLASFEEPLFELLAHRLRMLHYAFRGESKLAAEHVGRMERLAMRGASMWQAEVALPVHLIAPYALTGDVVAMKRTLSQLEALAEEIQSLRPLARAARATYFARSGRAEQAIELFEGVLVEMPPRQLIKWAFVAGIFAGCLNALGRYERAASICRQRLAHVQPGDRAFTAHYLELERQLALAEAGLGRPVEAAARLDALIEELASTRQPLVLGLLHEARANVARSTGDEAAFVRNSEAMRSWFLVTENPVLIARCQRAEGLPLLGHPSARRHDPVTPSLYQSLSTRVEPGERPRRSLELIAEQAEARSGFLYQVLPEGVSLVASIGPDSVPPGLESAVLGAIDAGRRLYEDDDETAIVETASPASAVTEPVFSFERHTNDSPDPGGYTVSLLVHDALVVGAIALGRGEAARLSPRSDFLRMVARALAETSAESDAARRLSPSTEAPESSESSGGRA